VRQKFIIIKTLKYQSLSTIDHNKALIERKQEGIAQNIPEYVLYYALDTILGPSDTDRYYFV
jgi:hypothetical protein